MDDAAWPSVLRDHGFEAGEVGDHDALAAALEEAASAS